MHMLNRALLDRELGIGSQHAVEDALAAAIIAQVNRGDDPGPERKGWLRYKLQAMRVPGVEEYIPQPLPDMTAMNRFMLERAITR